MGPRRGAAGIGVSTRHGSRIVAGKAHQFHPAHFPSQWQWRSMRTQGLRDSRRLQRVLRGEGRRWRSIYVAGEGRVSERSTGRRQWGEGMRCEGEGKRTTLVPSPIPSLQSRSGRRAAGGIAPFAIRDLRSVDLRPRRLTEEVEVQRSLRRRGSVASRRWI